MLTDIRKKDIDGIAVFLKELGEKAFRAKQIHEWLWIKNARSFDEMTNLPLGLRKDLCKHFTIRGLGMDREMVSSDKTRKYGFRTYDDLLVEGVLIPSSDRVTACISSQVGCPLNCSFCATAKLRQRRNMDAGEIVDQVHLLQERSMEAYHRKLSNLVFMGMGEPLLNYEEVMRAVSMIISPGGLGFSPRRLTLSTVGIADGIRRLGDDGVRFPLAVSLHTADDELRSKIMPVNRSNPLSRLSKAISYFHEKTGTRVTYEILLMNDINDSIADAVKLAEFCRITPCKINLIEYNRVDGSPYKSSPPGRMKAFADYLETKNLVVNVRRSRGHDIEAACGQLAGRAGR
jgi:23S rRNA (adenine2503-C2)-methyltransferase